MKLFKFLVVLFTILVIGVTSCHSQTVVVKDKSGKYVNTIKSDSLVLDKPVGIYTDPKGNEYTIYETKRKKVYILKTSKTTGKKYKQYLKIDN